MKTHNLDLFGGPEWPDSRAHEAHILYTPLKVACKARLM